MPEAPSRKASFRMKLTLKEELRALPKHAPPSWPGTFLEEKRGDADTSATGTLSGKHVQEFSVKAGFKIR